MSIPRTILKALLTLFVVYVLFHWVTGGQSTIIQGPPRCPVQSSICSNR